MRQRVVGLLERLAVRGHQARRQQPGRRHRHLLPQHRAEGQLVAVHLPGHPAPGVGPRQRPEYRVAGQGGGDRHRIGVKVEQAATALHSGGKVPQVRKP